MDKDHDLLFGVLVFYLKVHVRPGLLNTDPPQLPSSTLPLLSHLRGRTMTSDRVAR